MSVAKEGKVFERKKLLQPLLDTSEGTKITWISLFLTSPTPTVYSTVPVILVTVSIQQSDVPSKLVVTSQPTSGYTPVN